jgi:superfamily II DNA/RNA helicase
MTFDDLGLGSEVLQAVTESGYSTPTAIQEKAIPYVLMGRDILGCAQTGTGKTASFTLPMIDILAEGRAKARMPRSVILAPTRELASQVADSFERYGKYHKLSQALLIGGESMAEQEAKLNRGVDVLIATPGRMIDLYERGKILLADVKILVIDEADRMLDMGFIPDVERIVSLLPPLRQTLFFSATMPTEIRKLADRFLMNPKEISVTPPASAAQTVDQRLVRCPGQDKRKALSKLLGEEDIGSALIFCNRKRDVSALAKALQRQDFNAGELHGDMGQSDRMATLQRFKDAEISLLVCSDVAARGLDIPAVSHVFNYDVPVSPDDYVHRIGRTGRAGRSGKAITLATPADRKALLTIEKNMNAEIKPLELEGVRILARNEVEEGEKAEQPQKAEQSEKSSKTGESKSKRRRGGRKQKTAETESTAATAANANEQPQPAPSQPAAPQSAPPESAEDTPAPAKPAKTASRKDRKPASDGNDKGPPEKRQAPNGRQSKPFGDHTPAFLLRPVRASATA